jgi:hypothetical protein
MFAKSTPHLCLATVPQGALRQAADALSAQQEAAEQAWVAADAANTALEQQAAAAAAYKAQVRSTHNEWVACVFIPSPCVHDTLVHGVNVATRLHSMPQGQCCALCCPGCVGASWALHWPCLQASHCSLPQGALRFCLLCSCLSWRCVA